jgi:phosphoglycerate kinase
METLAYLLLRGAELPDSDHGGSAMAAKRTIRDLDVRGRRLLVRVDFNVRLRDDGGIASDWRIRAALPTIEHALAHGAALVLMSHLGRPRGDRQEDARLRLDVVARALQTRLPGVEVNKSSEVVGPESARQAAALRPGAILLLENLRFHPGEIAGDDAFGRELAALGEIYVNDAFATCHRAHASMVAAARAFADARRAVGFLVERELAAVARVREAPREPVVLLVGGAKVADKLGAIEALAGRVRHVLVGGRSAHPLLAARGAAVGGQTVSEPHRAVANRILARVGDRLTLPEDHVVECRSGESPREVREIPADCEACDIGPHTIERFTTIIRGSGTVIWSGPLGRFEEERFARGTRAVAEALAEADVLSIVGGGETAEAVERWGLAGRMSHISTGGGAFLAALQGAALPALALIPEK